MLKTVPPLGWLTLVAASFDLVVNRIAVRMLAGEVAEPVRRTLGRFGDLAQNLAAIAGLIVLGAILIGFLLSSQHLRVRRRLVIAAFSGIFVPTLLLAVFLPPWHLSNQIVEVGIAAANVLAVLLALSALLHRAPRGVRLGLGFLTSACLLSFAASVGIRVPVLAQSSYGATTLYWLQQFGELSYLAIAPAFAVSLWPRVPDRRSRTSVTVGALAAVLSAICLTWAHSAVPSRFETVLYGAQHVGLGLDLGLPTVYLVVLPLSSGVAALALTHRDSTVRQIGIGLGLILCAGFAPRAPGQLLGLLVGTGMLARSAIALADQRVFVETVRKTPTDAGARKAAQATPEPTPEAAAKAFEAELALDAEEPKSETAV
ncbi:MAG: hypothetical protein AAGF12_22640 [Myxococcota bacterium]